MATGTQTTQRFVGPFTQFKPVQEGFHQGLTLKGIAHNLLNFRHNVDVQNALKAAGADMGWSEMKLNAFVAGQLAAVKPA